MHPETQDLLYLIAEIAMAFAVVVFAIFPLLLNRFELDKDVLWRAASGGYLAIIATLNLLRIKRTDLIPRISGAIGNLLTVPAASGVVLMSLNFWLASD